jgi:hypothetical protein
MTSPRMCEKCHDIKPPRAHHCSLCERCILRMDHHCIWLGTCIGEHNYKSFILILVYAMALCAFYVLSSFRIMHLLVRLLSSKTIPLACDPPKPETHLSLSRLYRCMVLDPLFYGIFYLELD